MAEPRRRAWPWLLLAVLMVPLASAQDMVLEVLSVRHRPAADLVDVLRPLAGAGGAVEVVDSRLVVRATPSALARIKQALAQLDREPRSLLITVRQGLRGSAEATTAGVGGVVSAGGATVTGAFGSSSATQDQDTVQRIRTLEGSAALLHVGREQPVSTVGGVAAGPTGPVLAAGTAYSQSGTGFFVRPLLAGDSVTLELWVENTTGDRSGAIEGQRLRTSVAGRLGEWIAVGSALQEAETKALTILGSSRQATSEERSVSLLVEEVR